MDARRRREDGYGVWRMKDGVRSKEYSVRRTVDGVRRTEDGVQRTEDGGQRMKDGGRRTEDRGMRIKDGGRRMEDDDSCLLQLSAAGIVGSVHNQRHPRLLQSLQIISKSSIVLLIIYCILSTLFNNVVVCSCI